MQRKEGGGEVFEEQERRIVRDDGMFHWVAFVEMIDI